MAVIQSDFPTYAGKYYEGQLVDNGVQDVVSLIAEEDIKFGQPVMLGTTDKKAKVATDGDDIAFVGISVRSGVRNIDNDQEGYKAGEVISVLRLGRIAVKVTRAAAAGEVASFLGGAFTGAAVAGDIQITTSNFVEAGGVDSIIAVQLNGPNTLAAKA